MKRTTKKSENVMSELNRTATSIAERAEQRSVRQRSRLEGLARRGIHRTFSRLQSACVVIKEGGESTEFGIASSRFPDPIVLEICDSRAWPEIALYGALGSGEAYMRGWWRTTQLTGLVRALLFDRDVLDNLDSGMTRFAQPVLRAWHKLQKNTKAGARKNISAHYDLGDELFGLFLDSTMCYSSGIFTDEHATLYDASREKMDRLCRKLDLQADDHLLEIGTGWGGLALHAASQFGARVTTVTISENQYRYACNLIAEAGLADRVTVKLQDYRDIEGTYDKVVSVEMIEAVGYDHLDTYFERIDALLAEDGIAALQAITIADQQFAAAVRSVDFIKRYIFPGGFLPSLTTMLDSLTRRTSMRLFHVEDIGFHYARTLELWRGRFENRMADVKALGYSDVFARMWDYYLSYCEGGFRERAISTVQMVIAKPANRTTIQF